MINAAPADSWKHFINLETGQELEIVVQHWSSFCVVLATGWERANGTSRTRWHSGPCWSPRASRTSGASRRGRRQGESSLPHRICSSHLTPFSMSRVTVTTTKKGEKWSYTQSSFRWLFETICSRSTRLSLICHRAFVRYNFTIWKGTEMTLSFPFISATARPGKQPSASTVPEVLQPALFSMAWGCSTSCSVRCEVHHYAFRI